MSGIEVAGLVVGVVPIIVEILKGYSAARERLKTFVHHAQVVYDVQLRYRTAAANFSNDCQLLLKAVVDNKRELSDMIDDPKHSGWQDAALEERFRNFLGRDYQLFEEVVVKIRDILRETQTKLLTLAPEVRARNESLNWEVYRQAVQQVLVAFNIARKENRFRQWLDELDRWSAKLSHLRSQRCKLQKRRDFASGCLVRKAMPRKYSDIRSASQKLHESLQDSWSCSNVSHTGHQAKLSLNAAAEHQTVQLDVVITCRRKAAAGKQQPFPETPIWLHVQSITTNLSIPKVPQEPPNIIGALSASFNKSSTTSVEDESNPMKKAVRKKLKRVRFEKSSEQDDDAGPPPAKPRTPNNRSTDHNSESFAMLDLKTTDSVCCHLNKACLAGSTCKDPCLGYMNIANISQSFKLVFYDAGRNAARQENRQNAGKEAVPINTLLQNLQTLHQLTLAHKLAIATLQYHSTSWFPQDWNMKHVSFFQNGEADNDDEVMRKLQSLHLSTQFPSVDSTTAMQSGRDEESLKYMYGIRNMSLAKLGVALLEIGSQKDMSSLSTDPTPHDVISARKVLHEGSASFANLGKRYIQIARKCVDCDFSCGDNLDDGSLQSAVYTDVVCALEDMIKDWKRFLGIL